MFEPRSMLGDRPLRGDLFPPDSHQFGAGDIHDSKL